MLRLEKETELEPNHRTKCMRRRADMVNPINRRGQRRRLHLRHLRRAAHDANTETEWRREFSKDYSKTSHFGTAMSRWSIAVGDCARGRPDRRANASTLRQATAVERMDGPGYAPLIIVTLAGARQIVTFVQKDLWG